MHLVDSLRRSTESNWLPAVVAVSLVSIATSLALWLQPHPHSDWGYYWLAAGDPGRYERGGFGLWLLAVPKTLGFSPITSALTLNALSVIGILHLLHALDRTLWRLPTLLVAGYLLLISPYFGIVQLDLVAPTLIAYGMWHGARFKERPVRIMIGAMLVAFGVSTKPQFALVLWAMTALAAPLLLAQRRNRLTIALLGTLLAGSIAGFALDNALRAIGGRSEAIRTSSAVTLYSGLLVSGTGRGCGYWSVEAAKAAKADLVEPLHTAIARRLGEKPLSHWFAVVGCKSPEILLPPPYALYWLVESPNVRKWLDDRPDHSRLESLYQRAIKLERSAYTMLTLAMLMLAAAFCVRRHLQNAPLLDRWVPVLWVLSFWLVHAVFEIQGRYFLGMFLLLPMLCLIVRLPWEVEEKVGTP